MNKVLVIIVSYNWMRWIDSCLKSLQESSEAVDVLVVDNGSNDGTQEYLKENYNGIYFVQNSVNLGFGKANNMGLKYAIDNNYNYVYLLNQDAWIMRDTIKDLIKISMDNPQYGILSPFQMTATLDKIDLNFKKDICSYQSNSDLFEDVYLNRQKKIYDVPSVMAAHWFMPIDTIKKVGLFSPSFPHYAEDGNYCQRCYFRKLKVGIVPSLKVVHDREFRITPVEKIIYIKYVEMIGVLSNPLCDDNFKKLLNLFSLSIKEAVKYKKFLPLTYYIKILKSYRSIIKAKNISLNNIGAFL